MEQARLLSAANESSEGRFKRLFRAAIQFSAGTMVSVLASVLRVGVAARSLSTTENGLWLGLQLLLNYGGNAHFGTVFGMYRNVPILRAAGDATGAEREQETAYAFVLVSCIVGAVALGVLAPWLADVHEPRRILLAMLLLVATLLRSYFNTLLRAQNRFKEASLTFVVGAIVTVPGLLAITTWRLDGLLGTVLCQTLVETAYMAWCTGLPRPRIYRGVLAGQLRIGLLTLATTVVTLALTSADRTVMLKMCGATATGLYYIGANIVALVPTLLLVPVAVLTPQFFERVGRGEDLLPLVEGPLRILSVLVAAVCGIGAAVLPAAVHRIWPAHVPGLPAAIVALFSTAPVVLAGLANNVFYALDKQARFVGFLVASSAAALALGALGVRLFHGEIVGAIAGVAIALVANCFLVMWAAMRLAATTPRSSWRVTAAALAPTGLVALVVAVVWLSSSRWLGGDLGPAALVLVATGVVLLPFLRGGVAALRHARAKG